MASDWPFGADHGRDVMYLGTGVTVDGKRVAPGEFYAHPQLDNEREALQVLALVVAEWESDPMSVQCFDLRLVERGKRAIKDRERMERAGRVPPLLTEGKAR